MSSRSTSAGLRSPGAPSMLLCTLCHRQHRSTPTCTGPRATSSIELDIGGPTHKLSRPWTQPPSTAQILTAKVFRSWSGFATLLPSGRRANRDLEIVRGSDSALYGVRSVAHRLIPRCKSADRRSSFVCVRQVRNVIKRKSVVGRQHRGKTRQGQETRTQAAEAKEPSALGRQVHCRVDGGFACRWDADFPF